PRLARRFMDESNIPEPAAGSEFSVFKTGTSARDLLGLQIEMVAQLARDLGVGRTRARRPSEWNERHRSTLRRLHDPADRRDELVPFRLLGAKLLSTRSGQTIVLQLAPQLATRLPLPGNPAGALEPM